MEALLMDGYSILFHISRQNSNSCYYQNFLAISGQIKPQCLKIQKEDKKIVDGWNVDFLYYYDMF